ncbi:MAG: 1-deoxy-D-xylulose-5-phosphate synthase [Actinobacteria bacterium]|nr:1-deoxy-D-xylulose-5-phosphate synthase [Actinomycetota bacterium]
MKLLPQISSPTDLRKVKAADIPRLCAEIREFLVDRVARTGGHLGPNLGVVELTVALHRVFDSPSDVIIFDTGHQSYVHKIITGRSEDFHRLRKSDGISGYPSRTESKHDVVENSHASTALSWADGVANALAAKGELGKRHVVAVVGDGALTGGMSWEALNNIAGAKHRPLVILVNDNGRSYSPTVGGVNTYLTSLRTSPIYERFVEWGKEVLGNTGEVGHQVADALYGVKRGIKHALEPQGMFEELGLKYIGPIDGHDEAALEVALKQAKRYPGPILVHAITEKGRGYKPAEDDTAELFHAVGVIDPVSGQPVSPAKTTWTNVFGDEMVAIGKEREDVVALTAAMLGPTGLDRFAESYPDRTFDVGIAEQHAATSAAGMAYQGLHPVVAVYSTFLNRAFDQVLLDCALHKAGVTFVLDRSGITGDDGPSHHGIWDLSLLQVVPGVHIAAPRDAIRLRETLREAVRISDGPSVVRFPKGAVGPVVPSVEKVGSVDVLARRGSEDVLIVAIGALAPLCLEVAERLSAQGIGVSVIDPIWVAPLPQELIELGARYRLVVVVEDSVRVGGAASGVSQLLRDAGVYTPQRDIGVPAEFFAHGTRAEVLAKAGLTAQDVSRRIVEAIARLDHAEEFAAK